MPWNEEIELVRTLAQRVARTWGLDLFDVQLRREAIGLVVRVFIDRPALGDGAAATESEPTTEGVSIEDCRHVSHDLSAALDVADVLAQAYTLEVSSPGLDRPLRGADDYRRFAGRLAKIVVSDPIDGQQHLSGRLRGLDAGDVLLEGDRHRVHRIPLASITRARLDVEF